MTRETTNAKSRQRAETPAEWLEELGGALRMPYERAEAIREELAEHLRERVRDLELGGMSEAAAASVAVRELGDAAAVARRFRNADKTPIRRRIMNLAVIGIAGAALVTSVVAMRGEDSVREDSPRLLLERAVTVMREDPKSEEAHRLIERAVKAADSSERASELRLRIESAIAETDEAGIELVLVPELVEAISQPRVPVLKDLPLVSMMFARQEGKTPKTAEGVKLDEARLEDALKWLSAQAELTPVVRWRQLGEVGISADDRVSITLNGPADFSAVMASINESRGVLDAADSRAIDYRVRDGAIEFATRESFDRRESALVSYNISGLIESGVDLGELRQAITVFVHPESWEDNGGDLGTMMIVGNRLFVKAPPRMQEGVEWFIEQLAER